MDKKIRTILILAIVAVLLASTTFATTAQSAPAPQTQTGGDPGVLVSNPIKTTEVERATVATYWTAERMKAAIPLDIETDLVQGQGPSPASAVATGAPAAVSGNAPGKSPGSVIALAESGIAPASAVQAWYSYPFPYTRSYIGGAWPTYYPLNTNGKIFFTQYGNNYVCSGTSVTSGSGGNRRLVLTAGHCVHAGNGLSSGWSYNILFCPAYSGGVGPWGCWTSLNTWAWSTWTSTSNLRYDEGFIVTSNNSTNGYGRLGDTVGTQGLAWNQSYVQEFWSFGYPAAYPYSGNSLVWTTSSTAEADDPGGSGPYTIGIGSDETGGASGGGWIINGRLGAAGYLNGLNSYKYNLPARPLAMYGPYFDSAMETLWNIARADYP